MRAISLSLSLYGMCPARAGKLGAQVVLDEQTAVHKARPFPFPFDALNFCRFEFLSFSFRRHRLSSPGRLARWLGNILVLIYFISSTHHTSSVNFFFFLHIYFILEIN